MDSETSFQQSETPIQCAKGCGFFGTAATMNMCSKCYREHRRKEHQAAAVNRSITTTAVSNPVFEKETQSLENKEIESVVSKKVANRCGCCNKKVGVLGFKCRCGTTFCGSHRYPEEHNCNFDHKGAGQQAIAKDNPVVVADKIQRF